MSAAENKQNKIKQCWHAINENITPYSTTLHNKNILAEIIFYGFYCEVP